MFLTIVSLEKKVKSIQLHHTPVKTKIDKHAIEVSDWIECKINELQKNGFTGCYISNILPTHLNSEWNLNTIRNGLAY